MMMMMMMMMILSRQQIRGRQKTGSPKPYKLTVSVKCSPSKKNKRQETTGLPWERGVQRRGVEAMGLLCSCSKLEAPDFTSRLQAGTLHLCGLLGTAVAAEVCDVPDVGLWSPLQEVGRCGISRAASQADQKGSGCGQRISHSQRLDHKRGGGELKKKRAFVRI